MTGFGEYLTELSPPWLRGPQGEAWQGALGLLLDAGEEIAREATKARFVGACPGDALEHHGRERTLERFPGELDASYRARLLAAWDALHLLGTAKGIEDALKALGFSTAKVHSTVDAAPSWYVGAWPPAPRAPKPSWWDTWPGAPVWPAAAGDLTWWSRFWVVLDAPGPFGWAAPSGWGSKLWGGFVWGIDNATQPQVALVRRLIERWRPAHEICDGIFVKFSGAPAALLRGTDR